MEKYMKLCVILLLAGLFPVGMTAGNVSLNGSWDLTFFPQPREAVRTPQDILTTEGTTIKATVPGNVELDLLTAGLIKEPMIVNNVYA